MCGRFLRTSSLDEVVQAFEAHGGASLGTSFNVAPTTIVYAIRHDETHRVVESMSWGWIPFWAKDASRAANAINARVETSTRTGRAETHMTRCTLEVRSDDNL